MVRDSNLILLHVYRVSQVSWDLVSVFHHLAQPLLPNSHQTKQSRADSETLEIQIKKPSLSSLGTPVNYPILHIFLVVKGISSQNSSDFSSQNSFFLLNGHTASWQQAGGATTVSSSGTRTWRTTCKFTPSGTGSPHKRVCSPQTHPPSRPPSGQNRALQVELGRS